MTLVLCWIGKLSLKIIFFERFLFRVIAGGTPEDECLLYQLANFKKGGQLVEAFTKGGTKNVS